MKNKLTLLTLFILLFAGLNYAQTNFYVDPSGSDIPLNGTATGTGAWLTIQYAIDNSSGSNIVINVAAGAYDITSTIIVNKAVTILGPTSGSAIVRNVTVGGYSVFEIASSNVTIQKLYITLASTGPLPSPDSEVLNSLVRIQNSLGLTAVSILDNSIYVPAQAGAMSTWGHRAITVGDGGSSGITISGNTVYNTRNGIVIRSNNIAAINNNIIYNTKGGIMNYTGTQVDADNRTMSNNSWTTAHNEWDIVWNSFSYYTPNYQLSVLALSGANNNAYVVDKRAADATTSAALTGNRSHIFVNSTLGTGTASPNNGNMNLPYSTFALSIAAVVPGGTIYIADGTYTEAINVTKANLTIVGNESTPANVMINAGGLSGFGSPLSGIYVSQLGVTLKGFTLNGGGQVTSANPRYGINISGVTGVTVQNVLIQNFSRAGLNVTGCSNMTFDHITAINNGGNGLGLRDVSNSIISNVTTNNNLWGGIRIQTYYGSVSGLVISGTNSFGENGSAPLYVGPLYLEQGNKLVEVDHQAGSPIPITYGYSGTPNVLIQSTDFGYSLSGIDDEAALGYKRIHLYKIKADAIAASAAPIGTYAYHLTTNRFMKELATGNLSVASPLTISNAVLAAVAGNTINVDPGTYDEDVTIGVAGLNLIGAGASSTTIRGVIGGPTSTINIAASNITVAGFTITRLGNNPTDWNNANLNTGGISISGTGNTGTLIHDNILTGNRTGIDINNSSGHTIRNNVITDNRTGMIFRNVTNNLTVAENAITNNWTVGIVFLDASSGSNSPVQSALNCNFSDNNISGNWYGQIVDRQTGGSLPAPGANLKNFTKNWFGTAAPVVTTANSAEPGYPSPMPVEFGGTDVPPVTAQPTIAGVASANFVYSPYLNVSTDTNVETTVGHGTFGFQGDLTQLATGNISNTTIDNVVDSTPPGGTVDITTPGTLGHITYNGTGTVTLNNTSGGTVVITGGSPALTVSSGTLVVNGFTYTTSTNDPTILVNGTGNLTIRNCTIEASTGFDNSAIRVDDSGVVDAGVSTTDPGRNIFICTGADVAFNNTRSASMNAIGNWWGNANGPYNASTNPGGTGGPVTNYVNYYPWYTDSGLTTFYSVPIPSLTSPADGLTGVPLIPTFTWSSVTGATIYTIHIALNSAFTGEWEYTSVTNSISFSALTDHFPLTNNTTYFWRVSAIVAGVESSPSAARHFTTLPIVPVYVANPAEGTTVYYPAATIFSWYTGQLTTGLTFILQYKYSGSAPTNESFWIGATEVQTTNTYYTASLQGGRTYYWRVLIRKTTPSTAPYDYVYYPTPDIFHTFNTAGGASVTVTQSYPVGGTAAYTTTPTVYWYLDQYETGLTYQVAWQSTAPTGGDTNLFDNTGVVNILPTSSTYTSNLYYTLPTLPSGSTIYWQVLAFYSLTGQSVLSNVETFTTPSDPTITPIQPYLSYPVVGVTVYSTNPTLYWYLGQAAGTGLKYQIAIIEGSHTTDNLFTEGTKFPASDSYSGLYTTMYDQLSGLIPGHTYYWQVRSTYNGSTWSTNSTIESFVVAGGTTNSYAVASYPTGNPTLYTNRPTLYWYLQGSSLGISGYTVKWHKGSTAPTWSTITSGNTADEGCQTVPSAVTTYYTMTADLTYGEHYFWYVDSGNPNLASTGEFTIVGGTTNDPILSQPSDGSTVYSTSLTFSWFESGSTVGIQGYELVYSQSNIFDPSVTIYYDGGSGTGHFARVTNQWQTVSGLVPGATYYWKVRAWYGGTTFSNWVNASAPFWSFNVQVGSSLVQPIVGGPTNVTVNTLTPMLSWALPTQTAANSSYEIQLADNSNFTNAKSFTSSKVYVNVNGLSSNKNYYWRVRSKSSNGTYSYYSNMGKFNVGDKATAVDNNEIIPTEYSLNQNYPNPFNPSTRISFSLPQNSKVSLKIFDMLGREVKIIINEEMNAGNHSTFWNGDNTLGSKVSSGIYIYRITAGDFVASKKMVLIK